MGNFGPTETYGMGAVDPVLIKGNQFLLSIM